MSYHMVAEKLVDRLYNTIDNKEYYEVILYGLEIAISTFVNMILVISFAIVLGIPLETLVFCIFFMPLRFFSGGVHAKSHSACIGLFLLCELGSIFFSKQVSVVIVQYILIAVLVLFSLLVYFLYAGKHKKTSEEIRRKHRRLSLVIVGIDVTLIMTGALLGNGWLIYSLIAVLAVFCQSMALLPIWNRSST